MLYYSMSLPLRVVLRLTWAFKYISDIEEYLYFYFIAHFDFRLATELIVRLPILH